MYDTRDDLIAAISDEAQDVYDILFADGTLIIAETGKYAKVYMHCIQRQRACYGLSLNWDKLMMICINCNPSVAEPGGNHIRISHSLIYLGGLISDDGTITTELSRRIGMAYSDFSALQRVWSHANITRNKKMIFNACIISKLLYSLDVVWLRQNKLARIDIFQSRFLKRICRIQHSYYSWISNIQALKESLSIQLNSLFV